MDKALGYWKSPWPGEDAGPARRQVAPSLNVRGKKAQVISRMSIVSTMTVLRDPGEVFLLCHTGGDDAVSWVERIDPETLEVVARSVDLVADQRGRVELRHTQMGVSTLRSVATCIN